MSTGGGSDSKAGLDTDLQQGQFEFGPSQYDQAAITNATGGNQQTTSARYNQLGMGGSTPELQDLAQASLQGQAATGQEQTQDVTNPAFNPSLQTAQTNLPTSAILGADNQNTQALTSELGAAGKAAGGAAALGAAL